MRLLRVALVVAFLICLVALPQVARGAEGAGDGKDDDTVTLRIAVRDPNVTAVYQRARRNVFEAFVRSHPHIKVKAVHLLAMEGMGNESRLLAIAGGIEPQVTSLYYQQMHSYINQGFLAPIDNYLKDWPMLDEVPKQLWPVVTGDDGKRYGAIYTWPTLYLVYRKDLFQEVGLDPNHPPQNWDELFEYAKRLSDPDRVVPTAVDKRSKFGRMGMFLATSGSWKFANFVWQAGGDIVKEFAKDPHTGELIPLPGPDAPPEAWIAKKGTPDEFDMRKAEHKWKAVFDSPAGVKALEFYKKMRWTKWTRNGKTYTGVVRTGFGSSAGVNYQSAFARGEVAMAIMPLRVLQNVLEANIVRLEAIGIAPLPAGPTGIRASIVDGDCWVISSSIKNDKRKMDAAWEYIKFMTGKESRRIETQTYVESGYARFIRNPYWLKEFGYDEYFAEIDPQTLAAFNDALKYGRPEPYCPGYAAITVDMNDPVSKVLRTPDSDPAALLKETVKRINTFFFKLYPEEEMRFKRRVFLVLAIIVAAGLSLAIYMIVRSLQARIAASKSGLSVALKSSKWKHVYAWLFLLPAIGTIFVWSYVPLAAGSGMSFYDYKIMGNSTFVGLDNFIEAAGQPVFWKALVNTFYYSALTMTFGFVTPIILALFLSEVPRLKITFRVLFYLPALTSSLVLMFLWKQLLYSPSPTGLLNQIIGFLGIPPQEWLQDPRLAMICVVIPGVWAGAGPGSIIYLAALKTVPEELYEAAEIDGAGPFAKIRLVTLPYLKGLILINFFGAFIGSFHATQNIFVMTMGGPEKATNTLSLEIFFNAFLYLKFGYATAMAWIMGTMLIGFTLYQLRIFQRLTFTAGAVQEAKV